MLHKLITVTKTILHKYFSLKHILWDFNALTLPKVIYAVHMPEVHVKGHVVLSKRSCGT